MDLENDMKPSQESTKVKEVNLADILLREYDNLIKQVIHQDELFWKKSQFFIFIQSAFFAVTLQMLKEQFLNTSKMSYLLFSLFITSFIFNIYLCYVWFRTNRRSREYINDRVVRLKQIENDAYFNGILKTFSNRDQHLPHNHRSSSWEIHISTGFIIIWLVMFLFLLLKYFIFSYY